MAAVSAWGKPGSWALDAESNDDASAAATAAELKGNTSTPSSDFPSLAAAVAAKPSKKKKPQTFSLAELSSLDANKANAFKSVGLTQDELRALPTGPRERTPEELERGSSRGFSYSSYGSAGGRPSRDETNSSRGWGGSFRASDESRRNDPSDRVDSGPSRADEADDWGAGKRSGPPPMSERRERGAGFFDSQSRADESDSWISSKPAPPPPSDGRRVNGGGFDGPRERRGGFEMFNREESNGGVVDSDTWGRKREEPSSGSDGRPRRLTLKPRTLPLANGGSNENGEHATAKSKGSNPFGEARPREEVLAEKGQDWKKIDEKLESMKIRELPAEDGGFGKNGRGAKNGRVDDRIEKSWRKADTIDAPPTPPRAENVDEISTDN